MAGGVEYGPWDPSDQLCLHADNSLVELRERIFYFTTPPQLPPPSPLPTPTLLRTMYRVLVNGTDRMTTAGPDERSIYPLEGQVYYVPDQSANGRTTLSRLVNSAGTDHADAVSTLAGYSQDVILAYPWISPTL